MGEGTYDGLVFWGFKPLALCVGCHDFVRDWITLAMIPVLYILVCEFVVCRFLMAIRAFRPARAVALDEEGANLWPIPFVVRIGACELFEHVLANRRCASAA